MRSLSARVERLERFAGPATAGRVNGAAIARAVEMAGERGHAAADLAIDALLSGNSEIAKQAADTLNALVAEYDSIAG